MSNIALQPSGTGSAPPGGRTPVNRIVLNGVPLDARATSMSMSKGVSKHDGVTITVSSPTLEDTEGIVDSAVSFVYGIAPRSEFFYGYVASVTEEQRSATNLTFTMSILGATVRMQKGRPRVWANKSIPSVIGDLANHNLLGYHSQGHDHLWKLLVQTEDSDWQVSDALSQRIGYALFNWNGVLICDDPRRMYNNSGSYLALTSEANVESDAHQLLEFTPTRDSVQTYKGMGIRMAYLTSNGQVGWGEQPGYKSYRFSSSVPFRSQAEVDEYIKAAGVTLINWNQQATARTHGNAAIQTGMCVDVVTSTRLKDKKYDGKWLVVGLQHKMDNQSFQTMLSLARPSATVVSQVLPYRPFWESDTRGKPTMWLQEDRWMSSWSDSRVRSIM